MIKNGLVGSCRRWALESPSRQLILRAALDQKHRLLAVFLLGTAAAALEGLTFVLLARALEVLSSNETLSGEWLEKWGMGGFGALSSGKQFVILVVSAVFFQILKSICQVLSTSVTTILSTKAAQQVQQKVLGTVLSLNFGAASRHKIGELTAFVVQPAESVATTLVQGLFWMTNLLTILAYVAVLCTISLPLFVAALVLFSGVVALQRLVGRQIGALSKKMALEQADLSRKVVEGVGALRIIHVFQRQEMLRKQVTELQNRFIETMKKLDLRLALLAPLADSLLLLGLGGFLLTGFFLFREHRSTLLPDLLTFIAVLNRLSGKISQSGTAWAKLRTHAGRITVLNDLLSSAPSDRISLGGAEVPEKYAGIQFKEISLQYPGREEWALKQVNLELKVGSTLALVGPSGSGKSSLVDLLLRLYEPTEGKILISGVDLNCVNLESWRNQLGVVSQDTQLFNASIRENLLFAKPDAKPEDIRNALQAADAWEFVQSLPQGVETIIGERGFMLSGGQRQRLAIARALLRQAKILILDEATSALDTHAEQSVQATIDSLPAGGTRLIIAHRLSTIRNADVIAVLDQGQVVETGTHESLLIQDGLYASLWRRQTGEDSGLSCPAPSGSNSLGKPGSLPAHQPV